MEVKIPRVDMWSKSEGIATVLGAINPFLHEDEPLRLDFSECSFISPEGIALVAGLKLIRKQRGFSTTINMSTISNDVKLILKKSNLLKIFGHSRFTWPFGGSSLPILVQRDFKEESIITYIDREIMRRSEMPKMSEELGKEIRKSFCEIFGNVFNHSNSPIGGLVCGQVYPKAGKIQITFFDVGIGIANKVRESFSEGRSDHERIEWALRKGTSTLANGEEPRGLGLFLLRQFLKINEGEFHIYSNKGFFEEETGRVEVGQLGSSLNGTLINMMIQVRDDVKYILADEESL